MRMSICGVAEKNGGTMADVIISGGQWIIRVAVGVLLVSASISKFAGLDEFADIVASFGIRSPGLNRLVTIGIPLCELCIGVLVVGNLLAPLGALAAATLFLLFAIVTSRAMLNGLAGAKCGCIGRRAAITWRHAARNIVLAVAALASSAQPTLCVLLVALALGSLVLTETAVPGAVAHQT
jgi:uncharacterized membrane protein YphA (DoxX/SURF4 family)